MCVRVFVVRQTYNTYIESLREISAIIALPQLDFSRWYRGQSATQGDALPVSVPSWCKQVDIRTCILHRIVNRSLCSLIALICRGLKLYLPWITNFVFHGIKATISFLQFRPRMPSVLWMKCVRLQSMLRTWRTSSMSPPRACTTIRKQATIIMR